MFILTILTAVFLWWRWADEGLCPRPAWLRVRSSTDVVIGSDESEQSTEWREVCVESLSLCTQTDFISTAIERHVFTIIGRNMFSNISCYVCDHLSCCQYLRSLCSVWPFYWHTSVNLVSSQAWLVTLFVLCGPTQLGCPCWLSTVTSHEWVSEWVSLYMALSKGKESQCVESQWNKNI